MSQKDAVALAGEAYRAFAEAGEDDPGSPETWRRTIKMNTEARALGKYGRGPLLIGEQAQRQRSMEDRFGGMADAILATKCLVTDAESRWKLVEALASALDDASSKLVRMQRATIRRTPPHNGSPSGKTTSHPPTAREARSSRCGACLTNGQSTLSKGKQSPPRCTAIEASSMKCLLSLAILMMHERSPQWTLRGTLTAAWLTTMLSLLSPLAQRGTSTRRRCIRSINGRKGRDWSSSILHRVSISGSVKRPRHGQRMPAIEKPEQWPMQPFQSPLKRPLRGPWKRHSVGVR